MSILLQINPYEFFVDADGDALDAGYIYIGQPNLDPRQYPVPIYFDEALTIPAAQPLRTSNGYIVRNGSPTFLFVNGNYSIRVEDSRHRQIFYVPDFLFIANAAPVTFPDLSNPSTGLGLLGWNRNNVVVANSKVPNFFNAQMVSVWEFVDQITNKPTTSPETWDWKPAIDAMYAYIAANYPQGGLRYGKAAYFPAGNYPVSGPVGPTRLGIATYGDGALTSVIQAMVGTTGTFIFKAQHSGANANMGGCSVFNMGIDCNNQMIGGFDIEDGYDCLTIDNLRVSRVHADFIGFRLGPRTDAIPGQPVSQTILVKQLFVYKEGNLATIQPVVLIKVQEAQFIGCKSWAGGFGVVGQGPTSAWYLEDCKSTYLMGCSAVGAGNYGIQVRAESRTVSGVNIVGQLYENCTGRLFTSTSNVTNFPITSFYHSIARLEAPAAGNFQLSGLSGAVIDVGVSVASVGSDSEQCTIYAQRIANVTDNGTRNVILAHPNGIDNFYGVSQQLRVVRDNTPRLALGRGDTTNNAYIEWSSSSSVDNGLRLGFNRGADVTMLVVNDVALRVNPGTDNNISSGSAAFRWSVVFAGTGTINTSDAREKTPVRPLSDDEINAAIQLAPEIGIYQWLASVAGKGDDAREHVGMTVQKAIEVLEANGLDAYKLGFICYDSWEATPEELDDEGSVSNPAMPAGDRYSFRMDELYAFIVAGLYWSAQKTNSVFDARLKALEEK